MIYRSNLTCPDLTPHFKHLHSRVMGHSFGHDVPSDWADKVDGDPVFGIYKRCGMWTHDEAAILYNVAKSVGGHWADIGSHTGWTSAHIAANQIDTMVVDPMFANEEFRFRMADNCAFAWRDHGLRSADIFGMHIGTSESYFAVQAYYLDGVVIDGDHEPGLPLADAKGAEEHLADTGVILLHDFIGQPVREAATWLMDQGFHCRVYLTPHMVACCWRGDFTPPDHVPDPFIVSQDLPARCPDFDWSRVE